MKFLFICLMLIGSSLFAYPQHSADLAGPIKLLYQLEETKQLLDRVEACGMITIKSAHLGSNFSNAAWFPDERTICVNFSNKRSPGSVMRSLVFELHNALNQNYFDHLDQLAMQGRISKEKYIESVEQMEYTHAQKSRDILEKGVKKGLFPYDAPDRYVAPSFAEHYRVQREAGHSKLIGNLYDSLRGGQAFVRR
jgi:hypothetical protein